MITVTVLPEPAYLLKDRGFQYHNYDFLLRNITKEDLELNTVQTLAYDSAGELVSRKFLNRNGLAPSIYTLPALQLPKNEALHLFNPFHTFEAGLNAATLHYEFRFASKTNDKELYAETTVHPKVYETQTDLILPLQGRVLVYDGHDFYSHHRRLDFLHPIACQLGLRTNSSRYAYDFCVINEQGHLYQEDGRCREQWFGYGAPIVAPSSGKVVAIENEVPDNVLDGQQVHQGKALSLGDAVTFLGNYLILDHGNEEWSLLAHFKAGSICVELGQQVAQGQPVGQMGFSGSTGNWIHLHYELRDSPDPTHAEGLPSRFSRLRRLQGSRVVDVERGHLDTGEMVESL